MLSFANVIWGARCGKSARRVLLGETRSSGHVYSVRRRRESVVWREAPHRLPPSRLVSTVPFDLWAERWRRRKATGDMVCVRYADDIVLGFQHEGDARRFWEAMRERLREFSLMLHPEKTRLIMFGRYAAQQRAERGLSKPETFNFLGFTFICGKSKQGKFLLCRKSRRNRMQAKLKQVKEELRKRRHQSIPEQGKWLRQVVGGFFAYHAVPTNSHSLVAFLHHVTDLWRRSLRRRSQKDRTTWGRMAQLADAFLPQPRILHPWPSDRFAVKHPRWEPSA